MVLKNTRDNSKKLKRVEFESSDNLQPKNNNHSVRSQEKQDIGLRLQEKVKSTKAFKEDSQEFNVHQLYGGSYSESTRDTLRYTSILKKKTSDDNTIMKKTENQEFGEPENACRKLDLFMSGRVASNSITQSDQTTVTGKNKLNHSAAASITPPPLVNSR